MPTRIAGFVYTLSTGLVVNGATVTPRASDGSAGSTGTTNSAGFVAIAGLADKTWFGTVASSSQVFIPAVETWVQEDIHNQANVLSAHGFAQIRDRITASQMPAAYEYQEVTVTVETPTVSDNIIIRQFHQAVTIESVRATSIGGTTCSYDVEHGSTVSTATKLFSAAVAVATADTDGVETTSFNDATLAAGDYLRLEFTVVTGVTMFSATFKYKYT